MSVTMQQGTIALIGDCGVEEAETLLSLLQGNAGAAVDLAAAGRIHTALWQVLLALRPVLVGAPADPFSRQWLVPALAR